MRTRKDIDICIGAHGAGLTNCAFGREGVVLVELQQQFAYGFDSFQKIAHMNRGHHVFYDLVSGDWIVSLFKCCFLVCLLHFFSSSTAYDKN